ncbi:ROK family transcriptional regulator [Gymnodinialimonas sp. 2305UL16-5]|uniref:ROK family transcriptional regulator n=1 Tax=Gymnodinialimonas mytili TaxID=3126503 RepID=UPI00309B2A11
MSVRPITPGSNAERSRVYNRGLVLEHIRQEGVAGRAEIARASGLSTQAVSNIIAELVKDGWVYEAGRRAGQRGLPAVTYAIQGKAAIAFGVEIRPGALLGALIDLEGRLLFSDRRAVTDAAPGTILPLAKDMLDRALDQAGKGRGSLMGAGAVMPGPFGQTGLSGQATDLPGWDAVDPVQALSEALDVPVTVENDANAAAMAERVSGVAQGLSTYAYLYFGTGLGLGVVVDGEIYRGAFGNAGEIGHIPVPTPQGAAALEDVASRIALGRILAQGGRPGDTVEDLARAHQDRDPIYQDWLDQARPALGHAVHVIENLFDPESIVLGGAMPAPILAELAETLPLPQSSIAHRADRMIPRVLPGTAGRMTATIGAAALVVNTHLSPRLSLGA